MLSRRFKIAAIRAKLDEGWEERHGLIAKRREEKKYYVKNWKLLEKAGFFDKLRRMSPKTPPNSSKQA